MAGKRRKPELQRRRVLLEHTRSDTPSASSSCHVRQRSRQGLESPFEALPTEVLQEIFEYSANISLPFVCRQLASKLSPSQHLCNTLVTRSLEPILGVTHGTASENARTVATRLMNSRFFTFDFFTTWLRSQPAARAVLESSEGNPRAWEALMPSTNLLPPRKLLTAPFTDEKMKFLFALSKSNTNDIAALDPAYGEMAYQGLVVAIREGLSLLVNELLHMGVKRDTNLLRIAVIEAGCNNRMVLIVSGNTPKPDWPDVTAVDYLDPALWSWAERQTDGKGEWLLDILRNAQWHKEKREKYETPVR